MGSEEAGCLCPDASEQGVDKKHCVKHCENDNVNYVFNRIRSF